ncbi:unnamed protein product [Rhizoctonia solani]|uniref:Uncharacterized protein n=1 Tax=Rhizoctonia solani TaxID=456999 RepID=A0A8H3GJ64_9AGAM|nr:unnamed protein product [Rhizoctonia solani]
MPTMVQAAELTYITMFLYHFCNQSGENNWAIDAFCISSLASNSSYAKTSNGKANLYLKRNESGPRGTNRNNDNNNRASLDGYEDDYALNTHARRNAPPSAPSSHSTAANERPRTAEPNSCRNYDNNPCPQKKQCKSPRECSSSPVSLPPEPTSAELRRAAQVVASEEARNKALGASKDKAGAKPAAAPKGKERKNGSVPSRSKCDHVEVDDEELDDEPKLVSKKVDCRGPPTLSDDEPTPKSGSARQNKSAPKNTGKKAKGAAKSARRQEQSPPPDDSEQEQRSQKEVRRLNSKGPPKNRIEEPEEEPKELESPPPRKVQKRPTPKPPPPQEDDDELQPLPPSLIPQPATKGDGIDDTSRHPQADKPEAGPSKEATWPTGNIDKLGKDKPVGTIRIKRPVQQSDRVLRHNRN